MAGRKKAEQETMDAEVVSEVTVVQPKKMEFRLINPTEDSFLRVIKWNKKELEAAVKQKIASYGNVAYTEDNMKQAKEDRAELNRLAKSIEERRKMVKKIINRPYDVFELELREILKLIQEPIGIIDKQVKAFEDQQKEEKKKRIRESYDEVIGDLADVLSFEMVFDNRYLNQTYKLAMAQAEVRAKIEKVRTDLETIDNLESKYKLNAKDVYIKTMDLSKALAENKRLSDLEEKLEAERRFKEEDERKRLAEECRKAAEENVIESQESITEPVQNVSGGEKKGTLPCESGSAPVVAGTIQSTGQQGSAEVAPFEPKQEEKKYRTKFCAVGTRAQLQKLIQFMNENNIEYGRIQ